MEPDFRPSVPDDPMRVGPPDDDMPAWRRAERQDDFDADLYEDEEL